MGKLRVDTVDDNGMDLARKLAEEEEGIGRKPEGWQRFLIPTIAVAWSLFQLSLPKLLLLDSTYIRAIHLAFAMALVFLNYPLWKKPHFGIRYLAEHRRIPLLDILLAGLAAYSALYLI
ncbi:MAG TPA: TRAP transporter permease, partial [Desulfobulbus sp.]|nr:TRAP transporter permease [Desulfobulbus sp.]